MVGVALGSLLLIGVASLYLYSLKSFSSMSNYADLSSKNRHASDIVSRDIRSAISIASVSTNQLVLNAGSGGSIVYTFTPATNNTQGTLTRAYAGETNTLLKGVTGLMFSLYQRPTNGAPYEAFPAATAGNAKFVAFEWNCSRSVYLTEKDSQSVETALVELRNQ